MQGLKAKPSVPHLSHIIPRLSGAKTARENDGK
jgi:hypothetical protein